MFSFGFVILATQGYGDVVPQSDFTSSLSALEAVRGQMYIVVLITRLIGLHIVSRRDK